MGPYVRTPKTASGARAVQIVWSKRNGSRDIQHIGSAHDDAELAALRAAAAAVIRRGQGELDVGGPRPASRLAVAASRSARLWEALETAWRAVGFDRAVPDEVFKLLALGRVVEPTSKLDTIRVLGELGAPAPSYSTVKRRLRQCVDEDWRAGLQAVCVARACGGDGGLRYCLYDVTTLQCRRRHCNVYADVPVMPTSGVSALARAGWAAQDVGIIIDG